MVYLLMRIIFITIVQSRNGKISILMKLLEQKEYSINYFYIPLLATLSLLTSVVQYHAMNAYF